METLIVVLLIVNLLALVAGVVLVFTRMKTADPSQVATTVTEGMNAVKGELRAVLTAQRGELQQMISLGHQQIAARVQEATASQSQELARERESRSTAHRELRELLDQSINERLSGTLKTSLEENAKRVQALTESSSTQQEKLRETLR